MSPLLLGMLEQKKKKGRAVWLGHSRRWHQINKQGDKEGITSSSTLSGAFAKHKYKPKTDNNAVRRQNHQWLHCNKKRGNKRFITSSGTRVSDGNLIKKEQADIGSGRRALRHDVIIGGGSVGGSRGQGRICLILIVVGHIRPAEIK